MTEDELQEMQRDLHERYAKAKAEGKTAQFYLEEFEKIARAIREMKLETEH
jgi:hypothetical protein